MANNIFLYKKTVGIIILSIFGLVSLSACGGGGGGSNSAAISSNTGTVKFSVNLQDAPAAQGTGNTLGSKAISRKSAGMTQAPADAPAAIDCDATGVTEVTADVYAETGGIIATGGPWPCSAHSGTIENVPPGDNLKIIVEGKRNDGKVLFRGQATGITVRAGQITDVGVIQTNAFMSVDYAYLQYRTYEDPRSNQYRGWVNLLKFGEPPAESDIESIALIDFQDPNTPRNVITQSVEYYSSTYFVADYDENTGILDYEGPVTETGYSIRLPSDTVLAAGNYIYEVKTADGDTVRKQINYPQKVMMPVVESDSMADEWLDDGSLKLSWALPPGTFDRVVIYLWKENSDVLIVHCPPTTAEVVFHLI